MLRSSNHTWSSLGQILANNSDLYFGHLLNFANLHSLFANPFYHIVPTHTYTDTSVSIGSSCNLLHPDSTTDCATLLALVRTLVKRW
jgi:hypothetical protein